MHRPKGPGYPKPAPHLRNLYFSVLLSAFMLMACVGHAMTAQLPDLPPRGTWEIRDVTIIPADNDDVLPHRTVIVENGRIARIEPYDAAAATAGAEVIDGSGKFLIPGLVDAHVHIATECSIRDSPDPVIAHLDLGTQHSYHRHVLMTFLKAGVTSVANLGGSARQDESLLWLRDEITAGRMLGPQLYVGKRINGPFTEVMSGRLAPVPSRIEAPTTAADGAAAVRQARQRGYDFIKPYQFLNRTTYQAIVEESQRQGMITTGHLPELGCERCADRAFAFEHPMSNIAHIEELARYARTSDFAPGDIDALADLVAAKGVAVTPTLITLKTIVHMYVERAVPPLPEGWLALVDPVTRAGWSADKNRYLSHSFRDQEGASTFPAGYDFSRLLTRALWKRGVQLTVGTDASLPGLSYGVSVHQEMIELRAIGLTALEVLRAATVNAHALFDRSGGSGAVRIGERADLVLLNADPTADIRNVAQVEGIFVQGRWLSAAAIDAMLAETSHFMRALSAQMARTGAAEMAR
ncbi:MAG TPA: amidohydrolase family protein [Candidatus Synoicihabitans sp.]|nr:amidohydrolase family protein [Candidatus Synoicihabitans sp.]